MPSESAKLEFTKHAIDAMTERMIPMAWVEWVVAEPALREPDLDDPEVERFFRRIPEQGDRVLRVAINPCVAPWRVVSVFFDRNMKGKL
jgi:hypothetical protein